MMRIISTKFALVLIIIFPIVTNSDNNLSDTEFVQEWTAARKISELKKRREAMELVYSLGNEKQKFNVSHRLIEIQYQTGDFESAKLLGEKIESIKSRFVDQSVFGSALHKSRTIMGLIAFEQGDINLAISSLEDSLDLDNPGLVREIGPTMVLARKLLIAGHKSEVLDFLETAKSVWTTTDGRQKLSEWAVVTECGRIPDFLPNVSF